MAFGRRNRPGLIETAARTAVITGTASAVSGRAARRQAAAQPAASAAPEAAAAPAVGATEDVVAKIERLAALHAAGSLTDEEFAALKAQAIGS